MNKQLSIMATVCYCALAAASLNAGNTSVEWPGNLEDLTTANAEKAFSLMEASWLSYNNGEYDLDYTHAFDNGNKYDRSDRAIASGSQADFGFDFETPTVVDAYRIWLPKDDGISCNDRAPSTWKLQGRNNAESTWDTIDDRSEENGWGASPDAPVSRYYTCSVRRKYRYWRLVVTGTAKADAGYVQLAEIEFFDTGDTLQEVDPSSFEKSASFWISGMDAGVELSNLPVLVRISEDIDGFSYSGFKRVDKKDLCFSDGNGKPLAFEIDTWNENGESLVWVCVAEAKRGSKIVMHWFGDDDAVTPSLYKWDDYTEVVHFNGEEGPGSSSARAAGAVSCSASASVTQTAKIGAGVSGSKTSCANAFSGLLSQGKAAFSVWLNPSSRNGNMRLVSTKAAYGDNGMELIYVHNTGLYLRGNGSGNTRYYKGANADTLPVNTWTHYTAVLNETQGFIYLDGVEKSNEGSITTATLSGSVMLGGYNGDSTSDLYSGVIDEFRIYNGIPSNARVKAEYQAMADENFLTTSSIESSVSLVSVETSDGSVSVTVNLDLEGGAESGTVEVGIGDSEGTYSLTRTFADLAEGEHLLSVDNLSTGRYWFAVRVDGGAWTAGVRATVGVIPPVEWIGSGDGHTWGDSDNWSTRLVPESEDDVVFSTGVTADLSVDSEVETSIARTITIDTPYALTFSGIATRDIVVTSAAAMTNTVSSIVLSAVSGVTTCKWSIAEGKCLKVVSVSGSASLLKTGAGSAFLTGASGGRTDGVTVVKDGELVFSGSSQLGTALLVGGGEFNAVARSNHPGDSGNNAFNPFVGAGRSVFVNANGLLDLESDGGSGYWIENGQGGALIAKEGGRISLGARKTGYGNSAIDSFDIGGEFSDVAAARTELNCTRFTVRDTISSPVIVNRSMSVQSQTVGMGTFNIEDSPDVFVECTMNGNITFAWLPRDGLDKRGAGVLRLTGRNQYGGDDSLNSGATRIYEGTLLVDNTLGSGTGYSEVIVHPGATVGGIGTIGGDGEGYTIWNGNSGDCRYARLIASGDALAQAVVAPGTIDDETGAHVCGALKVGSDAVSHPVTFGDYSSLRICLGETSATDALNVHGTVDISATGTRLDLAAACDLADVHGGTFTILSATDGITGEFAEIITPKNSWKVSKVNAREVDIGGTMVEKYDALVLSAPGHGLAIIVR